MSIKTHYADTSYNTHSCLLKSTVPKLTVFCYN